MEKRTREENIGGRERERERSSFVPLYLDSKWKDIKRYKKIVKDKKITRTMTISLILSFYYSN